MTHTPECTCNVWVSLPDAVELDDMPLASYRVIHCPMHQATLELLEACKAALLELEHAHSVADAVYDECDAAAQDMLNDMLPEESNSKILALRAAIAKTSGTVTE